MSIPLTYNLRSIRVRWTSTLVAVAAIAGVVAVLIAVLAMASGFQKTLITSGSPRNAILLRGGATAEMESAFSREQATILQDLPGVARTPQGTPLLSPEVVVIAAFPMVSTGSEANVQIRGVSTRVLQVRENIRIVEGRFFTAGLNELVVGKKVAGQYVGMELGKAITFGGTSWTLVGIFDSGGTAFDSEIWCDTDTLNQTYKRPAGIFQSATVRLTSTEAFAAFKNAVSTDPRLTLSVDRESDYYAKQSQMVTTLIRVLGFLVAGVMAVGAVFGAINTMYAAVSQRSVEIATLRALGFRTKHILLSFVTESVFISLMGGALGILVILPINHRTASTMNWQTFSQISFAFTITPAMILEGLCFAVILGVLGGLFPAIRAARLPIAPALRGL